MKLAIFLRAINVGGNNKVPMAELRAGLEDLGFENVKSYIASGNIVVDVKDSMKPAAVADEVKQLVARQFGHDIGVLVRTGPQLDEIIATSPFRDENPKHLLVVMLDDVVDGEIDASKFAPDVCAVSEAGTEVYAFCPNGFSASKLTAGWIEKQAGATGTGRNWNTMNKMASMMAPDD